MIHHRIRRALPLLAGLLFFSKSLHAGGWPQQKSDLKPESQAVFGSLENGLRYVILPNKYPMPGRASLRLYMNAGSLMEEEDQRGMAHFLEHMAFNGSKNFPAGTMVETFQRFGMGFGQDTNAHTSFKETVYKLELPRVDEKMLGEGLQLFRDDLDGMLLDEKEIDRERGVILSEKLARDSVEMRIMEDQFQYLMPDALIGQRFPIGTEKTIKSMPRARFVDFYEKWYTPGRAIVVVVGDVDTKLVESLIKKHFTDARARRGESVEPNLGKLSSGRGITARLKTEMEAPSTEISFESISPADKEIDSAAKRRTKMIRLLADAMLNQRFSELSQKPGSPFMEAESHNFEMLKFMQGNGVSIKCQPEKWKASLAVAEQELRRALEHGFTAAEFDEARATILKMSRLRAEQKDTRKNADLANGLVAALADDRVFTDPLDDFKRVQTELSAITAEESLTALQKSWTGKDIVIYIGGNLKLDNASETILATFVESSKQPVTAPKQEQKADFAYTNFGAEGKVTKREDVKDLEITQAVFANGVRANLKKTDFEKNGVRILVSFGGGKLSAPADRPGLISYAQSVFEAGGLEKHSADDLRRIFASKTVAADFAVGDDSFILSGKTTPGDLSEQLQLLCAYMIAPGYRDSADQQFKKNLEAIYTQLEHTAEGMMQNEVVGFIHGGDERFRFPKRDIMEQRSLAELKAWLAPALGASYLEIAVAGDIDVDKTLSLLGATFGALPKRADSKPDYTKERGVKFPSDTKEKDFAFASEIQRAYAFAYWPTSDMSDIQRTRRLMLLGQILDDRLRLKIRQELGETYSPNSYHVPSDTYTGYGYMTAMATLKPEQVSKVKPMFAQIGQGMIDGGITEDEFKRAREPMLQQVSQMRRDNSYWIKSVLRNCQEHPERLDWSRSMIADIQGITKDDMIQMAKKYLTADRCLTVGLIPHPNK